MTLLAGSTHAQRLAWQWEETHTCDLEPSLAEHSAPRPTWQCEFCGRFYSERTAKDHGYCQQEYDRQCAERAWPA